MMKLMLVAIATFIASVTSAPAGITLPFLTFDNGNVGVRFGGYHASAGLGGLLSGDLTRGGLHAEAGTPYGQAAGAGLGGLLGSDGKTAGGLYAGATAGNGVDAAAGLGGATGSGGAVGGSFVAASSGASAGAVQTGKVVGGGSFSASGAENTVAVQPHKEVIERTVIPNYVEKTIQVPTYVEKTVRVPTFVEQRVRVPVQPTVIEKTVSTAPVVESTNVQTIPSTKHTLKVTSRNHGGHSKVKVVEKERVHPDSGVVVTKYNGSGGTVGAGNYYGGGSGSGGVAFTKSASATPQLFNDIFNIPISTLGAVNRLLNGIASGTAGSANGSFAVSKSFAGAY